MAINPYNPFDPNQRLLHAEWEKNNRLNKQKASKPFSISKGGEKKANQSGGLDTSFCTDPDKVAERERLEQEKKEENKRYWEDWSASRAEERAELNVALDEIMANRASNMSEQDIEDLNHIGNFFFYLFTGSAVVTSAVLAYKSGFFSYMKDTIHQTSAHIYGVFSPVIESGLSVFASVGLIGGCGAGLALYLRKAQKKTKQIVSSIVAGGLSGITTAGGMTACGIDNPAVMGLVAGPVLISIPTYIHSKTENEHVKKLCKAFAISSAGLCALSTAVFHVTDVDPKDLFSHEKESGQFLQHNVQDNALDSLPYQVEFN